MAIAALLGTVGDDPRLEDFLDGAYWTVPGLAVAIIVKMLGTGKVRWPAIACAAALAVLMVAFRPLTVPLFFAAVALWWTGSSLCRR
jgi:chromate transport protein ChrA